MPVHVYNVQLLELISREQYHARMQKMHDFA